eukprot:243810_1
MAEQSASELKASAVNVTIPAPEPILYQDSNLDIDEDALYANLILDVILETTPDEKLGFTVRIDTDKHMLQINHISPEGEAERVGLKQGDIILAVNDENIGKNPQIGIDELKKAKSSTETISISMSVCRRIFDHIMIKVNRAGIAKCDGKYTFLQLDDEYDSPIFMNEDTNMLILKSNYDDEEGESLWVICDESATYYLSVSTDLMPPNDSWSPWPESGKYPCPGLVFYNTQQKLIEIEEKKKVKLPAQLKKQESKFKLAAMSRAMSEPSPNSKHSRVFQTIHDQNLLIAAGVGSDEVEMDHFEDAQDDANEWKIKFIARYSELLKKCKKKDKHVKILRGVLKDMNASFYEYWLKDKVQEDENEKLKQKMEMMDTDKDKQIQELQQKLKDLEQEKMDKINDLQKEIQTLKELKTTD